MLIRLSGACVLLTVLATIAGCGPDYSPNTYSSAAVQQANKVDPGIVVGVREIGVSAAGVVGAATGAAAGGVAGSQTPGGSIGSAFGAIGGGLVGGLIGNSVEHVAGDTRAFEYIVRKPNKDLISVTQKDKVPLQVGTKVLVIAGSQARIVPDYTVPIADQPPGTPAASKPEELKDSKDAPPAATDGTEPPPEPVSATPLTAPADTAAPTAADTAAPAAPAQ